MITMARKASTCRIISILVGVVCMVGTFGRTDAAIIGNLPPVSGEVGYMTSAGWYTRPLTTSELDGVSGSGAIHLESVWYNYAEPYGYNYASPSIIVWYNASKLVEAASITFRARASVLDLEGSTTVYWKVYHPSYGWDSHQRFSWDTLVPDTTQILERGGYGSPPFYWVTSDNLIGVRLGAEQGAGGGYYPPLLRGCTR